ncbi:MAG: Ig-like domain-containing protein [Saprospiraceae bacterium]
MTGTRPVRIINFISVLACLLACASPKSPTGGPEDITPPRIIDEESTPNRQTNFTDNKITITFDEWVSLKDVNSQLVVSPLMPDEPEIKQKGKSVIIELPDSLLENTTYTLNFGDAITDLNEGNVLDNFVFVFSTGPVLDSIQLSGSVIDAVTLKPAKDVWVMLYPVDEDSVVYLRKPEYLAKTNDAGKWSMSYLRADDFQVIALKDENLNFLYDQDAEYLGWREAPINTGDITGELDPIFVFPRENKHAIREAIHAAPGWIKFVMIGTKPRPIPLFTPELRNYVTGIDGDTLHVWYQSGENFAGYAILGEDSTRIRATTSPSLQDKDLIVLQTSGRIKTDQAARFKSNVPMASVDTSFIKVRHDSFGIIPFMLEIDSTDNRNFTIKAPWRSTTRYHVVFEPRALIDYWGRVHDTIKHSIVIKDIQQYGDLTMMIDSLDSTQQYLVRLREGEQIIKTFVVKDQEQAKIVEKGLSPASYIIEIIEDRNQNGQWDTGDYTLRRQPEKKKIFTPENLRAGWELDVKMSWK